MYRHQPHYTWIAWEQDPDAPETDKQFPGFRASIRRNPLAHEVRTEHAAWGEMLKGERTIEEYYQVIAGRVNAWEYEAENEAGEIVPVPAPGEGDDNWQAFLLLEPELAGWLLKQIRAAHLPKAMMNGSSPAGSTDMGNLRTLGKTKSRPTS